MTIWDQLQFTNNPYSSHALPASAEGSSLLVGRSAELRKLTLRLENTSLHPTLEGPNGVGKTSLVMVAGYQAMEAYKKDRSKPLFIPMEEPLQIDADADKFFRSALTATAQALIRNREFLKQCGHEPAGLDDLEAWLNSPLQRTYNGSVQGFGFGVGAGSNAELNTSSGFDDSGLVHLLTGILKNIFKDGEGGLIGVIDNIELLSNSKNALGVLEVLRDSALNLPGIRWVLCGALGIVRATASSPRLNGRIHAPIEVQPISTESIGELIRTRLEYYSLSSYSEAPASKAPVDAEQFQYLFEISHYNLRDSLKYAQDFSVWLAEEDLLDSPQSEFSGYMDRWLLAEAQQITASIKVQPRQWKFFDELALSGGSCAPADAESYGFNSNQHLRSVVVALERAGLLQAEFSEEDKRRKTINITSKGWLVSWSRTAATVASNLDATVAADD